MVIGVNEAQAASAIRGTFSQLDAWNAIQGPFLPAPGTQLERDDTDWPPMPVSQVGWMGVTASLDHLLAVRWHLDPPNGGTIRMLPFAHFSLCRSALLGAAQSVWVLSPDSSTERVRRARIVVTFLQDQHLAYLKGLQTWANSSDANTDAVAAHVATRKRDLAAKRAADNQKGPLVATTMVREAAEATWGSRLADEYVLAWREGSGAAHALVWPLLGAPDTVQVAPPDAHGRATFIAGGSFGRIAQNYMAAYKMLEQGWILLRRRGL